jgi:hypothetical protein
VEICRWGFECPFRSADTFVQDWWKICTDTEFLIWFKLVVKISWNKEEFLFFKWRSFKRIIRIFCIFSTFCAVYIESPLYCSQLFHDETPRPLFIVIRIALVISHGFVLDHWMVIFFNIRIICVDFASKNWFFVCFKLRWYISMHF